MTCAATSNTDGCSSHHSQGVGAYCGVPTTGHHVYHVFEILPDGLQERGGRDGHRSVLHDAVQRTDDDELLQRQVQRVARISPSHPSRTHLQADEAFRRPSGQSSPQLCYYAPPPQDGGIMY